LATNKISQIFLQQAPAGSQNVKIFLLLYLVYDQIWLNYLVDDDDEFGYKIGKNKINLATKKRQIFI
jgi:hypothetical protein